MIRLIKNILLGYILLGIGAFSYAQADNTIHIGNFLKVNSGTSIYFIGDYTDSSLVTSVINLGDMYFNGNVINNGTVNIFGSVSSDGRAHLIGTNSEISGTNEIVFHNLEVNKNSNTDTVSLNKFVIINDSLLLSSGDMLLNDSLELKYVGAGVSSPGGGLIGETNSNRVMGPSFIKVTEVAWNTIGNQSYDKLKNVGLSLQVKDYLGSNYPILYRYNLYQECGGTQGSIERTFEVKNLQLINSFVDSVSIKYLDTMELGLLPNDDSISVYFTNDDRDNWKDIGGTYGPGSSTNSDVSQKLTNLTYITGAKDSCDYVPFIQFNQINNNVTPTDTILGVLNAQSCDSSDVNIQVIGDPGNYLWILPGGGILPSDSNTFHSFSTLGTYTLILEDRRGCIGEKLLTISSAPNGNADFTYTTPNLPNLCDGASFDFTPDSASIPGYIYAWDMNNDSVFEDTIHTNTNHIFPSDGNHFINLTVTTDLGCSVSSTQQITIEPIPVASFTPGTACPGSPVTFVNSSNAHPTSVVALTWDFDDDNVIDTTTAGSGSGIGGNASYVFDSEGNYAVTLTASSNGCTSLPFEDSVSILPEPVASFTFTNACEGQAVQFTDSSWISDATTLTYNWDFNYPFGADVSTLVNPDFTYSNTNTYSVSLTATSMNNCVHDTVISVSIDQNPTAGFSFQNACINTPITFLDTSQITVGTINTWNWDFDNSNSSTLQNDSETFTTAGNYDVSLVVETTQGCKDSISQSVTVYDGPTPAYSAINQCVGTPVTFTNTSTNSVSYLWNFPSLGLTPTNTNPTYSFGTSGWHQASVTATSANGCVGTYTDSVEVYPLPILNLGDTNTTCGTSFILDADAGNNTGANYLWNTGATTPQFTATYNGDFSVAVTSSNGCLANDTTFVMLNSAVVPNISDQSECDLAILDAGYPGALTQYSWTGSGGFTANTQTINVTTLGTTSYTVTVTDQNGCTGTASANVVISTSSSVNFGPDQIKCVGDVVTLDAGTPGSTYLWNTTDISQTIDVTQDGFYIVELTNTAGCISGDTIQFTFNTSPSINLGSDASYCVSHQLNAFAPNSSYLWNDLTVQPGLSVNSSGQYFVEVTNTITNCIARDTINIVINALPIVDLGNDTILCSYQSVLLESGNTGTSYDWNTGETTPDITVATTGSYSVEVTDANGCVNTDQIIVNVNPIFSIDLGVDRPYCEGASVNLELDTVFVGATYTWSDANGTLANTPNYPVSDTGSIFLDVVNLNGCIASDTINILPSNLSLHAVYLADSKVIAGDTVLFIDLSYPKPYTLEWEMSNVVLSTDTLYEHRFILPGDYDVTLTVNNGFCESFRTKTITVDPAKSISFEVATPNLLSSIEDVLLYPNPNNGDFNLKIKVTEEAPIQLEVFNILGQKIFQEKFVGQEVTRNYSMKNLRTGVYIVRVMSGKDSESLKFVKINN